jgi:uncharacterized membrane protein YeaQ/YmgE (transglycosylase-associated protein family)
VRWRADGYPEPWTLIKRDQCRHLAAYLRSDKRRPTRDQVVAVHVLTHEAMHLSGRLGEAVAECAAVQRDAHTARLLGARPADAAALAGAYWGNICPLMPDGYRSGDCRPGGPLDEGLADAPWLASVSAWMFDTGPAGSNLDRSGRSMVMLGAVLLGLVAGVIARMLMPGDVFRNMSGPTSWLASIALGLAGAIVGYLIFTVGLGIGDTDVFDFGGIISAIIGTVIVLVIVGFFARRRGTTRL